jgi:hypothetical protein
MRAMREMLKLTRLLLLGWFVVSFNVAPAAAHGPQLGDRKDEGSRLVHPLEGPGSEEVVKAWRDVVHNFEAALYSNMLVDLENLEQAQIDSGIRNLTPASSALIHMSSRLLKDNPAEAEVALKMARHAGINSPDVPDFRFAYANLLWRHDKSMAGEYVSAFFQGVRLSFSHLPSLHGFVVGAVAIFWAVGFLVMFCFSVVVLLRHLSLFSHGFGHLLPRGLSKLQRNVIGLTVLFIPFLLDLGLVPLFALWWVAMWVYQSRAERTVTVLMVLFVYLWPLLGMVTVNSMLFTGSAADKAYHCHHDICTSSDVLGLEVLAEGEGGAEGSALFAAAAAYARSASRNTDVVGATHGSHKRDMLDTTLGLHKRGMSGVSGVRQEDFTLGMGNVFFIKGMDRCNRAHGNLDSGRDDFLNANKYYDQVLGSNPNHWGALYNKSKVQRVLGLEPAEVTGLLSRAQSANVTRVREMEERSRFDSDSGSGCREEFSANRELAVGSMDIPFLWAEAFAIPGFEERSSRLPLAQSLLIGPLKTWMLALLATAVLLFAIGLTFGRRFLRPATRCIKCNEISCARCRPELSGTGLCNQCVYYRIRSSYVDPKETWLREKRIENSQRFRRKLETFLTFVLPGAGHLLRGRSVRGIIFMFAFAFSLAAIFFFQPTVQLAAPAATAEALGSVIATAFWSIIAFVVYFLSLIDIYSWR